MLLRGARCGSVHREHYYQRLVLSGWGHRKTVLAAYTLMVACGLSAVLYVHGGEHFRLALLLTWALIYAVLIVCVHALGRRSRGQTYE